MRFQIIKRHTQTLFTKEKQLHLLDKFRTENGEREKARYEISVICMYEINHSECQLRVFRLLQQKASKKISELKQFLKQNIL